MTWSLLLAAIVIASAAVFPRALLWVIAFSAGCVFGVLFVFAWLLISASALVAGFIAGVAAELRKIRGKA